MHKAWVPGLTLLDEGGGVRGIPASMTDTDVSMGFTAFGSDDRFVAYYGVVLNTNAYVEAASLEASRLVV